MTDLHSFLVFKYAHALVQNSTRETYFCFPSRAETTPLISAPAISQLSCVVNAETP